MLPSTQPTNFSVSLRLLANAELWPIEKPANLHYPHLQLPIKPYLMHVRFHTKFPELFIAACDTKDGVERPKNIPKRRRVRLEMPKGMTEVPMTCRKATMQLQSSCGCSNTGSCREEIGLAISRAKW